MGVDVVVITRSINAGLWHPALHALMCKQVMCKLISPQSAHFEQDVRSVKGALVLVDSFLKPEQWDIIKMSGPKLIFDGRLA